MVINQNNPATSLPVLYMRPTICETCHRKNQCSDEERLMHMIIMAITDFENENVLYGGYVCTKNKHQNVPAHKGEFLGEKYFVDEDLSEIFDLRDWEEI